MLTQGRFGMAICILITAVCGQAHGASPHSALTPNPVIQAAVDSVSQARLYSLLCDLTGENEIAVGGGEPCTLYTRFCRSPLGAVAAAYLKEQFESMGLETEYDYVGLVLGVKTVLFPFGDQRGWAVGKQGAIVYTEDGGGLWSEQAYREGSDPDEVITYRDVWMLGEETGVVVGNYGAILRTLDGIGWDPVASPTGEDLRKVFFTDSLAGYACGKNGTVIKTQDAGNTWASLSSGTTAHLNSAYFADENNGWLVGTDGVMLHTTDAGTTWAEVTTPTTTQLYDITRAGQASMFACGGAGTLIRSSDGLNWDPVTVPTTSRLSSVFFLSDSLGWMCGYGGAILKTQDGGDSWDNLSLVVVENNLDDICFIDELEGWAVGNVALADKVAVLHTTDGGTSWQDQHDNVKSGYRNVVAVIRGTSNPEEIYIICGHYDSVAYEGSWYVAPGANDNATGTGAVIECARVLKDLHFEATVRFICFAAEEQGYIGSEAYVRKAYERGDSIVAALNYDMIGYANVVPEDLQIIHDSLSTWLADQYLATASVYVPDLVVGKHYYDNPTPPTNDLRSLWGYGYDAIGGADDYPHPDPYNHHITDVVANIDFGFLTQAVKTSVAVLAELARIDTACTSVAGTVLPGRVSIKPNPCCLGKQVVMSGHGRACKRVEVFDVQGRLVALLVTEIDGSIWNASWSGQGRSGQIVSPGVYFVRPAGSSAARKLVLLH